MKTVGITAEYNPFHLGHAYQIEQTRQILGADTPVVCVMSGNWVQRGECALTDKWTRASLALGSGVDLVLELPLPWSIASAEGFARGAVTLLRATGVVDTLSFGSESGDLEGMTELANLVDSPPYQEALRSCLEQGQPFAAARQQAMTACAGKKAALLQGANDSLGVEYLRAAENKLEALAIPRKGAQHDSTTAADGFASASLLRQLAREGRWEALARWMLPGTVERLQRSGITDMNRIERAFLARLRTMTAEEFGVLPDSGAAEGLPDRLVRAAREAHSLTEFYQRAKTKRYAHSRLRRLALCAFLGLTKKKRPQAPAYLRVLGSSERGKQVLKEMKKKAALPILTKPAHIKKLGSEAEALFAWESRASDLFALCFEEIRPCGLDYITGPVIL